MAELVYPERKRCRACRRYFGFEVINGLYCCRACAGLPPFQPPALGPYLPGELILGLPRCCRTVYNKRSPHRTRPKVRWSSEYDARQVAPAHVNVYQCPHCSYWHLGTDHRITLL